MNVNVSSDVVTLVQNEGATDATRNITTNVIVDSGSTLVMGGFYSTSSTDAGSGMPFLRKLPIIGWLFGSTSHEDTRSELLFFVTPHIINAKRAGYSAGGNST
jgi:type II secretory pathway component GspD/PulD (secretin)